MPIFGRKKEKKKEIKEIKEIVEAPVEPKRVEKPKEEVKKVEEEPERPAFAPLFVKLNRYKQILNSMNYLKTTVNMIRNHLSVLNELDRLRADNLKLIQTAVEKVDKKLLTLDSEFMRPSGFVEESPELHDVESLEATIADLKGQIDQLKTELEQMA